MTGFNGYRQYDRMDWGLTCLPVLLLLIIVWGCTGREADPAQQPSARLGSDTTQPAVNKPVYNISFEKSRTFGSTDEHLIGVRGWGNVITDEKNRVYIPDYRTNIIHVMDSTGQSITHMGGEGKGPGEYLHMSDFQITPDYLYVYGNTLHKITAYSLEDLTYSHTILLNKEGWEDVKRLRKRTIGHDFYVSDEKILLAFYYMSEFNPELWEDDGFTEIIPFNGTG